MDIRTTGIKACDFASLRVNSGMSQKSLDSSEVALSGSLYVVGIYENDKMIAFGRVVGDGAISFVINDIMVDKSYWRKGYCRVIMEHINAYLDETITKDSYVCLVADKPANFLYEKFGFKYLDEDKNCAMYKKI